MIKNIKVDENIYKDIIINEIALSQYPENDIIEGLTEHDSTTLKIPDNEVTAVDPNNIDNDNELTFVDAQPSERTIRNQKINLIKWATREANPVSEFAYGFFSKAFPTLFPFGRGDITKARLGKNPSLERYFRHLIRINRNFANHRIFPFLAANIMHRHQALSLGSIFSKNMMMI